MFVSEGANVGDGVSVFEKVGLGVMVKISVVGVCVTTVGNVGINKMSGVAVTTPGVRDGMGVHTGNG